MFTLRVAPFPKAGFCPCQVTAEFPVALLTAFEAVRIQLLSIVV